MSPVSKDPVIVGEVVKPHGMEGELVVEPLTDFPAERFKPGNKLKVVASGEISELTVSGIRPHEDRLLLKLEEVTGREEAENLRKAHLAVTPERVVPLPAGEYYGYQLEGLDVYGSAGESIGKVKNVAPGTNPLLVIENPELGLIDFPAAEPLIEEIDLEENSIKLDLPRGWRLLARDSGG